MDDRAGRWLVGLAALVALWIVVYWLWEPGGSAGGYEASLPRAGDVRDVEPEPASDPTPVERPRGGATPGDDGSRVEAPRFREYTVGTNETLQRIALREYGTVTLWTAIAQANPLLDPNRLRAGRVIRLPVDPYNVQGRVVTGDDSGDADPEETGAGRGGPPVEAPSVIEYRVVRGDTLGGIATRFYGSSRWTDFLFQANRDRLSSPGAIRIGQTLMIPPKPAGDGP